MRTRNLVDAFLVFLILLVLVFMLDPVACATTITGHINQSGQPLNGYVDIGLVYPGTNGAALSLPGPSGHLPIYNGLFPPLTLDGNDTLLPRGTYYQVTYYDAYQAPLARMNYVITGATFDIGTAVPTPVTVSNINFLDLLGLRNLSALNLTLTNALTIGTTTYGRDGVTGAKQVDDLRFASAYASGSTTCGITEAAAALPAAGGTVILQAGSCTLTTGLVLSKPVTLLGLGVGGLSASTPTYLTPTLLINGTFASDLITISPSSPSVVLSGVTLTNFAIQGNRALGGASSGTGITLSGGSGSGGLRGVSLSGVMVYSAFTHGISVTGNVSGLILDRTTSTRNGGSGLSLSSSGGVVASTTVTRSSLDHDAADGLTVTGSGVGLVIIDSSTLASSTSGNGLNVSAGATSASIKVTHSTLTDNGNAGALFADGHAHSISDSSILPGSHQLYGVYTSQPTLSDLSTVQLSLTGNDLRTNPTADLFQSATPTNVLIYPQAEEFGSTSVIYTLTNPATVHFILPTVGRVCSGSSCYRIEGDGTITQWGATFCAATSCAVTFPISFSTTSGLTVTGTLSNVAGNITNVITGAPTITGATFQSNGVVNVGGGGASYSGGGTEQWHAVGH